MLTVKRHEIIMDLLKSHEMVSLQMILDATSSSESSIRRDLSALEKVGKLKRIHGGAMLLNNKKDIALNIKSTTNVKEKQYIAKKAAQYIESGDAIFLDAGSTTLMLIPHLAHLKLTVVTNGLTHVPELLKQEHTVYLLGGKAKPDTNAMVGTQAIDMLSSFHFDKAFLGANGVSLKYGYTTPDVEEAKVKSLAITQSDKVYCLVDDSKFNEVTFSHIAPIDACHIITNKEIEGYTEYILN